MTSLPSILDLVRPSVEHKDSFLSGLSELTSESEKDAWVYLGELNRLTFPNENFEAYVREVRGREVKPAPHFVPDTTYWALWEKEIVGRISLRHHFNEFLAKAGGHIGYIVRPTFRRKGIASEMLRQILLTPKAKEIHRLLLTCDDGNFASERTIVKNGGVLESVIDVGPGRSKKKRFWITLDDK